MAAQSKRQDPETLELRERPRPVTRLNRNALMIAGGGAALFVFGAMSLALKPPRALDEESREELYNVETKPTAEGLDALPKTYADVRPGIGAPARGDLGRGLLNAERSLAKYDDEPFLDRAGYAAQSPPPFRNSPETDAAREARLREAQIAAAAREAGVFFQLAARTNAINSPAGDAPEGSPLDRGLAAPPVPFGAGREEYPARAIRKLEFLEESPLSSTDNPHRIEDPATPFEVMAGTVIAASLITGINSDLPGTIIAQVTQNVYDTATGQYVLVPQGARLIGRYDSVIAFGQSRALLVWTRIIYPDGASVRLDNFPASNVAGYSGLTDEVDFHTFRLLKGIVLSTLLGVGTELSFDQSESDLVESLRESAQSASSRAGQKIVERNLDIPPTIKVRPGWPLRVIVHKDLVLRPFNPPEASQ